MTRLTRDGTAEPFSRDQIHTYGDRRVFTFSVQLTTSRIGNLTQLIHTLLYVITKHTYPLLSVPSCSLAAGMSPLVGNPRSPPPPTVAATAASIPGPVSPTPMEEDGTPLKTLSRRTATRIKTGARARKSAGWTVPARRLHLASKRLSTWTGRTRTSTGARSRTVVILLQTAPSPRRLPFKHLPAVRSFDAFLVFGSVQLKCPRELP